MAIHPASAGVPVFDESEAGFTLIELIVSMVTLLVISGTVTAALIQITNAELTLWNRAQMHSGVRGATELLQQEVGQAGRVALPAVATLAGGVAPGTSAVAVSDVAGMFVGEQLTVGTGASEETVTVTAVDAGGSQVTAAMPIPDIHPGQFRGLATFVMAADGTVQTPAGDPLCRPPHEACPPAVAAWRWTSEGWRCPALPVSATTFYVDGDVVVEPAGHVAPGQVALSLLATGSITLRGDMHLRPALPGVLLVAGEDVRVEGALRADAEEGLVAAGEQVAVTGASRLAGVILAAGTGARSAVVVRSELGGGLVVVSNGALAPQGVVTVRVLGWRRHQA